MDRRPFLAFIGLFLFHMAWCTTVVPLCEPGVSDEKCTTAFVQNSTRRRARIHFEECDEDKKDFCLSGGECRYIADLGKISCKCREGYSGERCMFSEFLQKPISEEYVVLTAILSVVFVIALAGGSYLIYKRFKDRICKKHQQPPAKYYKEATTYSV